MKSKGFTLIELLAVIIILGILMLIAIPSVTAYINNSRKNTYVETMQELIKATSVKVNSGDLDMYDTDTTYYIPTSAIELENGNANSPYGKLDDAYVVVTYDGENYDYYFVGKDEKGMGIEEITKEENITSDSIKEVDSVDKTVSITGKSKIVVFDEELNKGEPRLALSSVSGGGSSSGENNLNCTIVYPEGKTKETVDKGNIVKICNEEFYVVKHDGNNLVLLAKYNLKVGEKYTFDSTNGPIKVGEYTVNDEGYGMQSSETLYHKENNIGYYNGVVSFSNTNYWNNDVSEYPANVYNANSNIKQYVDNYARKLGIDVVEARLIYSSEVEELGCRLINQSCGMGYLFLSGATYWTGSAGNNNEILFIAQNNNFSYSKYNVAYDFGIRPVIVI